MLNTWSPMLCSCACIYAGAVLCCASKDPHCGLELDKLEQYSPPVVFEYSGPLGEAPSNLTFYSLGQSSETIALAGCGGTETEQWRVDVVVSVPLFEPLPFTFDAEGTRASLVVQKTKEGAVRRSALDERRGVVHDFDPTTGVVAFELEGSNHDGTADFFISADARLTDDLVPTHEPIRGRFTIDAIPRDGSTEPLQLTMNLEESAASPMGGPVSGTLCDAACDGAPIEGRFAMPHLELEWSNADISYRLQTTWLEDTRFVGSLARRQNAMLDGLWDVTILSE